MQCPNCGEEVDEVFTCEGCGSDGCEFCIFSDESLFCDDCEEEIEDDIDDIVDEGLDDIEEEDDEVEEEPNDGSY